MAERGATFVVRDGGQWAWAPVPVSPPTVVALDEVLAAVARMHGTGPTDPVGYPADARVGGEPLAAATLVAPVWAWVGQITPAGVMIEDNDGVVLALDPEDLRLLDALREPVTVGALAAATGIAEAAARLGRLVAAGRVKELAVGARGEPAGSAPGDAPGDVPVPSSAASVSPGSPVASTRADGRIGVHAVWQEQAGPALSLGMLTASARAWDEGALNERFVIGRPETARECLAGLAANPSGPAVLLCSNYVWSVDYNLQVAREAKAICPALVVIHGGPSTPKYPGDAEHFLDEHGEVADILVRGEGEVTLCLLLEALAPTLPDLDPDRLADVAGITFRDPGSGRIVRTPDAERVADLDILPSPYLTGEFDHIDPEAWLFAVSIETNRGCPYGCTFCDWGSATLSRIRKFGVDRVLAELEWAAVRGIGGVQICDANFGIMSRDVEIARGLADIRRRTGYPTGVGFTPPKNTIKHITQILDLVMDAGLMVSTAISLQTTDGATLAAVDRSNISTDHYLALAADLRRRGHPLMGDLLLGLPAQTYASYKADLQFFIDHQIMARTWILKALPNSPMNAPDYRARFEIETDQRGIVTSTADLSAADLERAMRLRRAEIIGQRLGVLRHLALFLQWDHGIAVTDLLDHVVEVTTDTPLRFPLVTWVFEYFDLHATAAVGWRSFYAEIARLLVEDFGMDAHRRDLEAVLQLQAELMPAPERRFPASVTLAHDYVAYHRDATESLYTSGYAATSVRPFASYPSASFTVTADPLGLCDTGLRFDGDSRDPVFEGDFAIGQRTANELASPLLALLPVFGGPDAAPLFENDEGQTSARAAGGGPFEAHGVVPVTIEAR